MIKNRYVKIGYKLLFGLLGLAAVATEIIVLNGRGAFNPANFFSYFTIQSNLLAGFTLLLTAIALLQKEKVAYLPVLRGASTLYMVITGIVFSVLLSGQDPGVLTAVPFDNLILHYVIPVVALLDWIFDPPAKRLGFRRSLLWLIYPLAYVTYSLIRGSIVGWYPYPFLNPMQQGYGPVAVVCLAITVCVVGLSYALVRLPRFMSRRRVSA